MSHFRLLLMIFCKKNREKSYNVERTVLKVLHKVKVKLLSHVRLFATPWTVACTRLLYPWDFLGKSTGVGCHFLLQGTLEPLA